ncbi:MAG: PqqD family protein [Pseudomonadota bacterium]
MSEIAVSDQCVFDKQKDIVHRTIAGESLLVPIRGELADMQRIFALNPVADFIWQRIDGTASLGQITSAVTVDFDTDAAQAATDTAALIADLAAAGLIVRVR